MSKRKRVSKSLIERALKNSLMGFAKRHDSIIAITKGINPEKGSEIYYFIVKPSYEKHLENEITDLESKLYRDEYKCRLAGWPCQTEISNYILKNTFLGNLLWERD